MVSGDLETKKKAVVDAENLFASTLDCSGDDTETPKASRLIKNI